MATSGGRITSGGGFSTLYTQPLWQVSTVNKYFDVVATQPQTSSSSKYSVVGRAYPDLALLGYNYRVIIGGTWYSVSGTSASTPVLAGSARLLLLLIYVNVSTLCRHDFAREQRTLRNGLAAPRIH
jgi:subtilase family serine protease